MRNISFMHPELFTNKKEKKVLYPVFIPFFGCEYKCIFCAQDLQTGEKSSNLLHILNKAKSNILAMKKDNIELAFFGGTFTALAEKDLALCLGFAKELIAAGIITSVRCSTRVDKVSRPILQQLKDHGFSTVELGVQSFNTKALSYSQRYYTEADVIKACRDVKEAGLELGIQLMPGMPGSNELIAYADVEKSIQCQPDFVRLYPCLVFPHTKLAGLWKKGLFTTWNEEEILYFLAQALTKYWEHGISVIRMGLMDEQGLQESLLAGYWHPALGSRVKARALCSYLGKLIHLISAEGITSNFIVQRRLPCPTAETMAKRALKLYIPQKYSGEFWGSQRELQYDYEILGLLRKNVHVWDKSFFQLQLGS